MQDRIHVRLLGGFGVTSDTSPPRPIPISSPRQRALLAYLALQPSYSESRERLAALLWGDGDDGQARKRFRQSLLRLRREFADAGVDPMRGDRDTLALDPAMVVVDAREFLALSKAGTETDLGRALDLYQGDLLDGISVNVEPFEEWVSHERLRFRTLAAQLFERRSRTLDERGSGEGAIAVAERLVALDASNEAAQRHLIDLLARHRSSTAALTQAEAAAQFVKVEFGCELEPETQRLIAKIRSTPPQQLPTRAALSPEVPRAHDISGSAKAPSGDRGPSAELATATTAQVRARASLFRSGSLARWALASSLAALILVAAAFAWLRPTSDASHADATIAQPPSDTERRSPAGATNHVAAVSQAVEGLGTSAIIVLPFSPTPPESGPVVRFADLVSTDLINNLTRVPGFRVIAHTTSLQYAGRPLDVGALETELGVEYAVEGDVRLEDSKVRINIALIDVKSRLQVWAERYERDEADQVAVKDEIVRALARQLHLTIMEQRGRNGPTDNPSINETLGRAWAALNLFAFFRGGSEAEQLFQEVLRTDPHNASAMTGLGALKYVSVNTGQTREDHALLLDQAESLLHQASSLKPRASLPYYFLGLVTARRGRLDEALHLYEKTIELNPSYAPAYGAIGFIQLNTGRRTEAIENVKYAIRLSPKDNYLGLWSLYLGRIYIELGDDVEAERWLTQAVNEMPNWPFGRIVLAAFLALHGDVDAARAQAAMAAKLAPKATLDDWIRTATLLSKQPEHRPVKLIAGLRLAVAAGSMH